MGNVKVDINAQVPAFREYLRLFVIGNAGLEILNELSKETNVFIFSGIIRNFLIGDALETRDIDFVIENVTPRVLRIMRSFSYKTNQFGGAKLKFNGLSVDVWLMRETWGLKKMDLKPNVGNLLKTVFFNSSAIVFDFNNNKFIYTDDFVNFLSTRTLDVVYYDNPNKVLCLFNVYYYKHKYCFEVATNLKQWVKDNYLCIYDFDALQIRHNGCIRFERNHIISYLEELIRDV